MMQPEIDRLREALEDALYDLETVHGLWTSEVAGGRALLRYNMSHTIDKIREILNAD